MLYVTMIITCKVNNWRVDNRDDGFCLQIERKLLMVYSSIQFVLILMHSNIGPPMAQHQFRSVTERNISALNDWIFSILISQVLLC